MTLKDVQINLIVRSSQPSRGVLNMETVNMSANELDYVVIGVEVKSRELFSRLLLANEFLKRGVSVVIGQLPTAERLSALGGKAYIFGKCGQKAFADRYRELVDQGWRLGAIDEEGLLPNDLASFAELRFGDTSNRLLRDYFFFGEEQFNYFKREFPDTGSFFLSGNPRVDLWKARYHGYYDRASNLLRSQLGRFWIFPLNLAYYTNQRLRSKAIAGAMGAEYAQLASRSEYIFDEYCKLSTHLRSEHGIITRFRPHPADSFKEVVSLLSKHGVAHAGSLTHAGGEVSPWLLAAEGMIHNCCTTAVEAAMMGVNVVSYTPKETSLYIDDEVNDFGVRAPSVLDATGVVIGSGAKLEYPLVNKRLKSWKRLYVPPRQTSSELICERIIRRTQIGSRSLRFRKLWRDEAIHRGKYIKAVLSSLMGSRERIVLHRKFENTSTSEIRAKLHFLQSKTGTPLADVERVGPNLFAIHPRENAKQGN
ncbi:surface carbohydrate biosynthesis protein [Rhodopirellula baltica]|uniref:Uncharacterized protein n=1 Tax=Rhodopirellula baltica WH47 TaxID=991778 RepID=F2ALQ8_RHOBT|nr:surface carbohydrate biosynthesis protein [Rhodopirellula baltica]EGF29404.1 hypothetical protein RBWH47_02768 [Rhodopirellula baltica WH47]